MINKEQSPPEQLLELFTKNSWKIIIVGILLVLVSSCIVIIPAGNRGILLTWGAIDGVLNEGLHFKIPIMQNVEVMSVRTLLWKEESHAGTNDLQSVTTTTALNFHMNPGMVDWIYQTVGTDIGNIIISPAIDESVKAATAQFTAEQLITNRTQVKLFITTELSSRLNEFNIILDEFSITDMTFSVEYDAAIELKQVAQQDALRAEQELNRIRIEATQRVVQAQAEADSILAVATAQALANELLTESLTDEILRKSWIEKWDGVLPVYMLGSDASLLLEVNTGE